MRGSLPEAREPAEAVLFFPATFCTVQGLMGRFMQRLIGDVAAVRPAPAGIAASAGGLPRHVSAFTDRIRNSTAVAPRVDSGMANHPR